MSAAGLAAMADGGRFHGAQRADEELEREIVEIDRMLETPSAWLTPRSRGALLAARDVIVHVLKRRKDRWPPLKFDPEFAGAGQRRRDRTQA
jgi:hypothetical protein